MKKTIVFGLLLILCTSLTACQRSAGQDGFEAASTTIAAVEPTVEPTREDNVLSNAVYLCQFVKDCLGEPDSFQIHSVSHIAQEGNHCYYLDFSHEVKNGEMERTYYFAEFDSSTLLCIVNEWSAIYYQTEGDYTSKYTELSALFQAQSPHSLDLGEITAQLH